MIPGSGGASYSGYTAGSGGGAVRIDAGNDVTINGTISANAGGQVGLYYFGGGSGGSILVNCKTVRGSGSLKANGSNAGAYGGGGGGGGRVSVKYNVASQVGVAHTLVFQTSPGIGTPGLYGMAWTADGELGTLYFPDTPLLTNSISRSHSGVLVMPGTTNWAVGQLVIVTNCYLRLPDNFRLKVTNSMVIRAGGKLDMGVGGQLRVGQNLLLTNNAGLTLRAAQTNSPAPGYGALLAVTGDVRITHGAMLYPYSHPTNGATPLLTMRNLTIATATAGINADYGGYGTFYSASVSLTGLGPGKGPGGAYGSGGGYGGEGGMGGYGGLKGGATNGLASTPIGPGSSGGAYMTFRAGPGGGSVRLQVTSNVTVNGTISANGHGGVVYGGGGSGGGVHITCRTFDGTGIIRANGGVSGYAGGAGGGGGRIAIGYNTGAQASKPPIMVTFYTSGAAGAYNAGNLGTIYFPDAPLLTNNITRPHTGRIISGTVTNWSINSLTVTTNCNLCFPNGFLVQVASNVTIRRGHIDLGTGSRLYVGGNLVLTNNGTMTVRAGTTNAVMPACGSLVQVTGDIIFGRTNCWIYPCSHATNGTAPLFKARNVMINATNAGFNADGKGYAGGNLEGTTVGTARGPGGGKGGGTYGGGGGHGGKGGNSNSAGTGGNTNDAVRAPALAGGGGGGYSTWFGANGGGQIRIEASGNMVVNGVVSANGVPSGDTIYAGGGSGGSIYLQVKTFSGAATGRLWAKGANSGGWSGSGGGGRIAIWCCGAPMPAETRQRVLAGLPGYKVTITNSPFSFLGQVSVTNGTAGLNLGGPGSTFYLLYTPPRAGMMSMFL